ncbi:MAG: hypothetical protein HY907_10385 [Deltaproteobacteria bacterium]|nr:hypothetical protein [Deltaproteobacteria bacterium]
MAKLIVLLPTWLDDEEDIAVVSSTEDACFARALASRAGVRRHASARQEFDRGDGLLRRAGARRLSKARRVNLLVRAEEDFRRAKEIAVADRSGERVSGRASGNRPRRRP